MTDIDQLNRLREAAAAKLTIQAARATTFQAYYDNQAGIVAMLSQPDRQIFKTFLDESSANWCELVVSAVSQRLQVVGFRFDDSAAADAAWQIWQANQLDADAELAQTVALTTGSAFALVQPDEDNPTGVGISIESPLQATVLYEPGNRRKRAAGYKCYAADYDWLITGQSALGPFSSSVLAQGAGNAVEILITPDEIVTWYPGDERDRPLIEPNPTGVVNLVELVPQPALLRPPRSELESAMPIQDRINTTIFARMVATDFGAFRTITATGVKIAKNVVKADDGSEAVAVVAPFNIGANRLLASEDPASKFGSIPGDTLAGYLSACEQDIHTLAAITQTPEYYFPGTRMVNLAADAIKAAESGLVKKCERRALHLGEGWEDVERIALGIIGNPAATDLSAETIWADFETRSEGALVDALTKMATLNVPTEILWRKWGATPQEITQWRELRAAEPPDMLPQPPPQPTGSPVPAPTPEPVPADQ
jgi:hypothetical protein